MNLLRFCKSALILLSSLTLLLFMGLTPASSAPEPSDIGKRINAFTFELLNAQLGKADAAPNTILSAQSIFHGLAMSYVASGGDTRKELSNVLHFPADDATLVKDLSELRKELEARLAGLKLDVSIANSIWIDSRYAAFRKEYLDTMEKGFGAAPRSVSFANRDKVSKEINAWISDKTRGKITDCVSPDDLSSRSQLGVINEPALVSVNAIYFKSDWGSKFDKPSTEERDFRPDKKTIEKALMMHQRSLLRYSADREFQFLEIPYVGGTYSMCILLPKEILSMKDMAALCSAERLYELKRNSFVHEIDVLLPKFEMRTHLAADEILSEMGAPSVFDPQKSDLDRMIIKKPEAFKVYISRVYHDAWIEVHEEGTEAAAATTAVHYSIGCSAAERPAPPIKFHADHPFLFMIQHKQSGSILFAGCISKPAGLSQK